MVSRSFSQQIEENFLAPAMSETIPMTVHARYRTRWRSDVRIDAAYRINKSGPAEIMCAGRLHEAQAAREQRGGRVAVYFI